jgi:hypothetical protein
MNLRSIYLLCKEHIETVESLESTETNRDGRRINSISGWDSCRAAILKLQEIPFLKGRCTNVFENVPSYFISHNKFDVLATEWNSMRAALNELKSSILFIIELYESMGLADQNDAVEIDVKLPRFDDFSAFTKVIDDLEFIISKCPFLKCEDEKLYFKNVDVGSTWLTFLIVGGSITGGSVLINNLLALVDKSIILRSHYISYKQQKQQLEDHNQAEDEKKVILGYLEKLYKEEVDSTITEMENVSGYKMENADGDERRRLEQCMDKMGKLIEQGLQIHAAIDSPQEVKVLFKSLEMKYISIGEEQRLLEDKEEDE